MCFGDLFNNFCCCFIFDVYQLFGGLVFVGWGFLLQPLSDGHVSTSHGIVDLHELYNGQVYWNNRKCDRMWSVFSRQICCSPSIFKLLKLRRRHISITHWFIKLPSMHAWEVLWSYISFSGHWNVYSRSLCRGIGL